MSDRRTEASFGRDDPARKPIGNRLRAQIEKALRAQSRTAQFFGPQTEVASVVYAGRDNTGRPMYQVRYRKIRGGSFINQTFTFQGGQLDAPRLRGSGLEGEGPSGQDPRLDQAKSNWLTWIAENSGVTLTLNQTQSLTRMVENWKGTSRDLDKQMNFIRINNPVGPGNVVGGGDQDDLFGDFDFGDVGGGGFAGPQYRAPDRRVVEDFVKGAMVSLIGTVDDGDVDRLTSLYMTDHRRNFDSAGQEIDPSQSVLEALRNTETYQQIHQLRPESEDERSWVSQRRQAGAQGGLQVDLQEEFAIEQATVGGDLQDVQEAGALEQTAVSGTVRGTTLENKIRGMTQNFFSGVR